MTPSYSWHDLFTHVTWLVHICDVLVLLRESYPYYNTFWHLTNIHVTRQACVAVCCIVLRCVAVCYSVLQCVAVCCSVLRYCKLLCPAISLRCHHDSMTHVTWLIHTCALTHLRVTWRIHVRDMMHWHLRRDSYFTHVTWLVRTRDVAYSHTWRHVFTCWCCGGSLWVAVLRAINLKCHVRVAWLIHRCDMTHLYVWHDIFMYVKWLIHTCDVMHSHVGAAEKAESP